MIIKNFKDMHDIIFLSVLRKFDEPTWKLLPEKEKKNAINNICKYFKKRYNIEGSREIDYCKLKSNEVARRSAYDKNRKKHYITINENIILKGIRNNRGGISVYKSGIKAIITIAHELYHCKQEELFNAQDENIQNKILYEKLNSKLFKYKNNIKCSAYIEVSKEKYSTLLYFAQPVERKAFEKSHEEIKMLIDRLNQTNKDKNLAKDIYFVLENSEFDINIERYKITFNDPEFKELEKCLKKYVLNDYTIKINQEIETAFIKNAIESIKFINTQQKLYCLEKNILTEEKNDNERNNL